jgi:glycosyltransferase involved in cell wall biosynthesis
MRKEVPQMVHKVMIDVTTPMQHTAADNGSDPKVVCFSVGNEFQPHKRDNDRLGEYTVQPKLLIASRVFGASGQPWLWRQVDGLRGFRKELLCWERLNVATYTTADIPIHVLEEDPAPYDGEGRWQYRLRNLKGLNFYAAVGEERRKLLELNRRVSPDVIFCYFGDIAMRLLPMAQQAGVPLVAYFHGDFQFLDNKWYQFSLVKVVQHFAAVVVINQIERDWMLQHGVKEEKLHVIPCGAPTELFHPRSKQSDELLRFVMVSRLSPAKGCEWSIKAFAHIAEELPYCQLHIYGDGPLREKLQRLVDEFGLGTRVEFHGWVSEHQLADILPTFDVFLQHSLDKEGFGVSIVEAAACGLPVVVTPVGGIAEHVVPGETGLCVPEKDVLAMASAMLELARSPEMRKRLGEAGRNRAVEMFDASFQTQRLEQVLLSVIGR